VPVFFVGNTSLKIDCTHDRQPSGAVFFIAERMILCYSRDMTFVITVIA